MDMLQCDTSAGAAVSNAREVFQKVEMVLPYENVENHLSFNWLNRTFKVEKKCIRDLFLGIL